MKNLITYLEERRLVARFQRGDRHAFDTLFSLYSGRILAFALTLTRGCHPDAEDLVQETFIAAFQSVGTFRGGSRLLTWLLGITLRRFRDGKRRPHPVLLSLNEEYNKSAIAEPTVEQAILSSIQYQQALAQLDEAQRIAFVLVAAQGRTYKEAAALLEIPLGTIKWRVARATKQLRQALSDETDDREKAMSCVQPLKTKN